MGKFDGILLCTDLDDTLLTADKRISEENKKAIEYFKKEGGLFTFATGRVPLGAGILLEYITPNAPMICFNGAGIYDFSKSRFLWSVNLDGNAVNAAEYVDKNFPSAGIEINAENHIYFSKLNHFVREHQMNERFPDNFADYHDVTEKWRKVIFMVEAEEIPQLKELIAKSDFADKYTFIRSGPNYYEMLPKNIGKGKALLKLAEILKVKKTIGMGDNENDIDLIQCADIGVAVANAIPEAKNCADLITVDNESHAAAAVIRALNDGKLGI